MNLLLTTDMGVRTLVNWNNVTHAWISGKYIRIAMIANDETLPVQQSLDEIQKMLEPKRKKQECSRCYDDEVVYTRGEYRLCKRCYQRYGETIVCPSCGEPSETATTACDECQKILDEGEKE